jgi:osmotically-inducible protein OsmY
MWTNGDRIYVDIVTALERELGSMGRNIAVSIADGVVTLNGHVATREQKTSVEQAVASVRGVRALAEGVHVIGESVQPLSDTTIAHAIVAALDTVPGRPDVFARVEHGWITLSGSASAASYEVVEQALECVSGVRGITSEVLT